MMRRRMARKLDSRCLSRQAGPILACAGFTGRGKEKGPENRTFLHYTFYQKVNIRR